MICSQCLSSVLNLQFVLKVKSVIVDDVARAGWTGRVSISIVGSRLCVRAINSHMKHCYFDIGHSFPVLRMDQWCQWCSSILHPAAHYQTHRTPMALVVYATLCLDFYHDPMVCWYIAFFSSYYILYHENHGIFLTWSSE